MYGHMKSRSKNVIRVVVLAAIFAWPGVETYRYVCATREVAASEQRLAAVSQAWAQAKAQQKTALVKTSLNPNE